MTERELHVRTEALKQAIVFAEMIVSNNNSCTSEDVVAYASQFESFLWNRDQVTERGCV